MSAAAAVAGPSTSSAPHYHQPVMSPMGMSHMHQQQYRPQAFMPQHHSGGMMTMSHTQQQHQQQQRGETGQADKAQWEQAFSAHESRSSTDAARMSRHELETTPLMRRSERAQQPLENEAIGDGRRGDALAQVAGHLLESVESSERDRIATAAQQQEGAALLDDKLARSSFMQLMRKLRDGDATVQGDKVVEQLEPATIMPSEDRPKALAAGGQISGPASESSMAPRASSQQLERLWELRQEEQQRQREAMPSGSRELDEQLARNQQAGHDDMRDIWADEDATRESRERQEQRRREAHAQQPFQGDGGFTAQEWRAMVDDGAGDAIMHLDGGFAQRTRGAASTRVPGATESGWAEHMDEDELNDPRTIVGGHDLRTDARAGAQESYVSPQQREWYALQDDWDKFDSSLAAGRDAQASTSARGAQNAAVSRIGGYTFAQANPHVAGAAASMSTAFSRAGTGTGAEDMALATYDSVLRKEADVLESPGDAGRWLALGVQQQEFEREAKAIAALERALEIDPSLAEAYLALAVSYTNEGERYLACDSLDKWVTALASKDGSYARALEGYRELFGPLPAMGGGAQGGAGVQDRHLYLTNLLIQLAQTRAEAVDADVQIALGVLFNASDEFEKASDCFGAALSTRPEVSLRSGISLRRRTKSLSGEHADGLAQRRTLRCTTGSARRWRTRRGRTTRWRTTTRRSTCSRATCARATTSRSP